MSTVVVNSTVKTTVTFRSFVPEEDQGAPEDPVSVTATITNNDDNSTVELTPVNVSTGTYYVEWTPTIEGNYTLTFLGIFVDDTQDEVSEDFDVIGQNEDPAVSPTLNQGYTLNFAAGLSPMYIAPEELDSIFGDAPLLEIAEQIQIASSEVKQILKLSDGETPPLLALDYIKAAAACSLSKVFEETAGNEISFRLGDLSVMTRNFTKESINRGNAGTWCELAFALRRELIASGVGMKAVVRGSNWPNPIPHRRVRSHEGKF